MNDISSLKKRASAIRKGALRALYAGGGGHVGGSLSSADILAALYFYFLNVRPDDPYWSERDRFILSKGHANAALVAALAERGFFSRDLLDEFNFLDSKVSMHPDMRLPGIEMHTGALGHGMPVALGMALGALLKKHKFRVIVMVGDGELQEGSNWEAIMFAGHKQIENLLAIVDYNKVQQSAPVEKTLDLSPIEKKWSSFGWYVEEIDGHDVGQISSALDKFPFQKKSPSVLICHTVKGKGVDFAENTYLWHSNRLTEKLLDSAISQIDSYDK